MYPLLSEYNSFKTYIMKNCTCEPSFYCPEDNLHYPAIQCDYCDEQQVLQNEEMERIYQMIDDLETWLGKKVKPLRVGKPKPSVSYSYQDDDLPF